MKVICAGLIKTGTKSLAKALRILGYTVYDFPEHSSFHMDEWLEVYCQGKVPDFVSMYNTKVDAVTDIPPSMWFQEIYEAFPDSKVILSVRDNEDVWVKSVGKQLELIENIGGRLQKVALIWLAPIVVAPSRLLSKLLRFVDTVFIALIGSMNRKSTVLFKKKYREHNQRVQAVIPKEKLLIFNVKQGWLPLCEFLGCDIPQQEFPRENVALSFSHAILSEKMQDFKRNAFVLLAFVVLLASVVYLAYL